MKKKNKKLLIPLIALGCAGVVTLSASLAACSIIQKNTNSEYKDKITKLLSEIKDEIKILEGDQRKEVNDFFDYINQVENSLNENTNKKDDYNELLNRYTTFAKEIYNQEKIKLSKLIDEIKNILKTEFSDEKYSSIHQSLSKVVVDKSVLLDQESNSTYVDLILAQKDLLKALEEANKNKEAIDNNLKDELKAKQDKFKEKLSEAKNNNINIYENNNDDELKTILKPLEDFINELLGKIESLDSQQVDKNNNELDKILEETLEKITEYNDLKNKAIQKYLKLLEQANELKDLFENKNASEFINELNNFMSNIPNSEEIKNFSVSKIEAKSEELSSFLEDILLRFNQVVQKQDELKKHYDSVITNELSKYDSYPTIKNDLEEKLNNIIKDYDRVFDNNELDSKFNEINNALNKAEEEKNKQNENTSDESDDIDYKKILLENISKVKENELIYFSEIRDYDLYLILNPLNIYVDELEKRIDSLNNNQLKNEISDLELQISKVREPLLEFNKYKEKVIKEHLEALENYKVFIKSIENSKYDFFKKFLYEKLDNLVDEETMKSRKIPTWAIKDWTGVFSYSIEYVNNQISQIESKQDELKRKYDSAIPEVVNYNDYPEIKAELQNTLDSIIENYKNIFEFRELEEKMKQIENALRKAELDKRDEDNRRKRLEIIKNIKDFIPLVQDHVKHRSKYNDPGWDEIFRDWEDIWLAGIGDGSKLDSFTDEQLSNYYSSKFGSYLDNDIRRREDYVIERTSSIRLYFERLESLTNIYKNGIFDSPEWSERTAEHKNAIDNSLTMEQIEKLTLEEIKAKESNVERLWLNLNEIFRDIKRKRERVSWAIRNDVLSNVSSFAPDIYNEASQTIKSISNGYENESDVKKLEQMESDLIKAWQRIFTLAKESVIRDGNDKLNELQSILLGLGDDFEYNEVKNEMNIMITKMKSYLESEKDFLEIVTNVWPLYYDYWNKIDPKIQEIQRMKEQN